MKNLKVFLLTFFISLAFFGGIIALMVYPSGEGFDTYIEADTQTPGIPIERDNISGTALFEINTRSDGFDSTKLLIRLSPTENTIIFSILPNNLYIGEETISEMGKQSNLYNTTLAIAEEFSILIDRYAFLSYGDMINILEELPKSYIEIDKDLYLTEQTSNISFTLQSGTQELNPITFLSIQADPSVSDNIKNAAVKEIIKAIIEAPQLTIELFAKYEDGSFGGRDILAAEIFLEEIGDLSYDVRVVAPNYTTVEDGVILTEEEKEKFIDNFS